MNRTDFHRSLSETIAWCAPRARADSPRDCLRSAELVPMVLDTDDRSARVRSVVYQRSLSVRAQGLAEPSDSLADGRLLAFYASGTLSDAASEVGSKGLFDVHNVPPWDTWVSSFSEWANPDPNRRWFVVCWIPPELLALADTGIEMNIEECIQWIDESALRLRRVGEGACAHGDRGADRLSARSARGGRSRSATVRRPRPR